MANETNTIIKGKKKTYVIDHKTIWDPKKNKPLVTGEINDKNQRVVETSNPDIQKALESMGYSDKHKNRFMHQRKIVGGKVKPNKGVISRDEAEKRAK